MKDGSKEKVDIHELFCKIVMAVLNMAANGVRVKELVTTSTKQRVAERVLRYWLWLWEMDEMSLSEDALKQQSSEKENNWLNEIKHQL